MRWLSSVVVVMGAGVQIPCILLPMVTVVTENSEDAGKGERKSDGS